MKCRELIKQAFKGKSYQVSSVFRSVPHWSMTSSDTCAVMFCGRRMNSNGGMGGSVVEDIPVVNIKCIEKVN